MHDYWNDPNLNEGEKYLRDYLLNKRYLDNDESDSDSGDDKEEVEKVTKKVKIENTNKSTKSENTQLDYGDFSEEEKEVERQEEFERKYNFRFEDPDPEFIKVIQNLILEYIFLLDNNSLLLNFHSPIRELWPIQ